jgi:hypothetical protein
MPPELRSRTDLISMSAAARLFNVNIHTISDLTRVWQISTRPVNRSIARGFDAAGLAILRTHLSQEAPVKSAAPPK